jgi:hypothetical protein
MQLRSSSTTGLPLGNYNGCFLRQQILHANSKVTHMPLTDREQFCKRHQIAWLNHRDHYDQTDQKTRQQGIEAAKQQT